MDLPPRPAAAGMKKQPLCRLTFSAAIIVFLTTAVWILPLAARGLTGKEVMEKQEQLQKADTEYGEEVMLLVDVKSNTKEKRYVRRYSKDMGNNLNRYLVVFLEPADIKATSLLTHETVNEDDQWLYMPATNKMQRIAQSSKKSYFMGTDFTYEDMEPEDIENFAYTILKQETLDHVKPPMSCYVIEAVPGNKQKARASAYGRRLIWVDKETFVTTKAEFYDKRDRLIKVKKAFEFEQIQGAIFRPRKTVMDNLKKKHKTLTLSKKRQLNQPIENSVFSERFILSGKHCE